MCDGSTCRDDISDHILGSSCALFQSPHPGGIILSTGLMSSGNDLVSAWNCVSVWSQTHAGGYCTVASPTTIWSRGLPPSGGLYPLCGMVFLKISSGFYG